ncbi:MAG: hypothetical protein ACQEQF_00605 [Bacillota bacterium]
MKKSIVIINEQHTLMEEQEQILNSNFDSWETKEVPASGWNIDEMESIISELTLFDGTVVMASPVPYMVMQLGKLHSDYYVEVKIFHNDNRKKVELPNGKVIHKVAKTGWQLV